MRGKMKVVVLAGGTSTERDVSLVSGSMIYKALKRKGHQAILLDVYLGYQGDWEQIFERNVDWTAQIGAVAEKNPDLDAIKALRQDGARSFFGPNVLAICQSADAVFMALHGANGEDGKIQACFELLGIPYTGTDFVSSAMAMDKGITQGYFQGVQYSYTQGNPPEKGREGNGKGSLSLHCKGSLRRLQRGRVHCKK